MQTLLKQAVIRAKRYLSDEENWWKGETTGPNGSRCFFGAIADAYLDVKGVGIMHKNISKEFYQVRRELDPFCAEMIKKIPSLAQHAYHHFGHRYDDIDDSPSVTIVCANDMPQSTHEDLMTMFDMLLEEMETPETETLPFTPAGFLEYKPQHLKAA